MFPASRLLPSRWPLATAPWPPAAGIALIWIKPSSVTGGSFVLRHDPSFGAGGSGLARAGTARFWPRSRIGEKCLAQSYVVAAAKPLGNERLDALAQQFGARIAEGPLGLGIHHDDLA